MDVPQERGAIIFAQGRPIGRSIVPTVVAYTLRSCVWTCETRVKSPPSPSPSPSPSPPPPPRTSTSGVPARVRSTRDAYSSSPIPYHPPVSRHLRVSYLSFPVYHSIRISSHSVHSSSPLPRRRLSRVVATFTRPHAV